VNPSELRRSPRRRRRPADLDAGGRDTLCWSLSRHEEAGRRRPARAPTVGGWREEARAQPNAAKSAGSTYKCSSSSSRPRDEESLLVHLQIGDERGLEECGLYWWGLRPTMLGLEVA
jgi:hypothetical protein